MFKNNKIIPSKNNNFIKFVYNTSCYNCKNKDLEKLSFDGSLCECKKCGISILMFEYLKESDYQKVNSIKKETFDCFLNNKKFTSDI